MNTDVRVALIAGIAALFGTIIGACASITASHLQLETELRKIQAENTKSQQDIFQSKASEFLANVADLISYFDANNEYHLNDAKARIAAARRSAFELAIYLPPETAIKAIHTIEALNHAASAKNPQDLLASLQMLHQTSSQLTEALFNERKTYATKYNELVGE
jgi:hypothetical protein